MKKRAFWAMGALAALSLAASAEESLKNAGANGIDLGELIAGVAKRSGKPIAFDARLRAPISLAGIEPAQVSFEQLLAILDMNQFTVTEAAGIVVVVPDTAARQLTTPVYADANFTAKDGEIVTLLVTPRSVCAAWLVPVLRPLMPQAAHLAADVQTNSLIVNDRAGNVRRIASLVEQLDKRGKGLKDCPPANPYAAAPPAGKPVAN